MHKNFIYLICCCCWLFYVFTKFLVYTPHSRYNQNVYLVHRWVFRFTLNCEIPLIVFISVITSTYKMWLNRCVINMIVLYTLLLRDSALGIYMRVRNMYEYTMKFQFNGFAVSLLSSGLSFPHFMCVRCTVFGIVGVCLYTYVYTSIRPTIHTQIHLPTSIYTQHTSYRHCCWIFFFFSPTLQTLQTAQHGVVCIYI